MDSNSITYINKLINKGQTDAISMRNLYNTLLVADANNDSRFFRIPIGDFFIKHRDELNSIIMLDILSENMFYKPKSYSLEKYGTTELWLSVLRINNMKNITEFHQPIIKCYDPVALKTLIGIFFKREKKL